MAGTKRDLSDWNEFLVDKFTVCTYTGDDDFGNPVYADAVKYPCRIDYIQRHQGAGGPGTGQMEPRVWPSVQIICNIYPVNALDRIFIDDFEEPATSVMIDTQRDQFGPHHMEITAEWARI